MRFSKLKEIRIKKHIETNDMCDALGLVRITYYKKETGDAPVKMREVVPIVNKLEMDIEEFCYVFFNDAPPFQSAFECRYAHCSNPLRSAREAAGLSAEEVAGELGLAPLTYAQKENHNSKYLNLEYIEKLGKLLKLTYGDFNTMFFNGELPYTQEEVERYCSYISIKKKVG